MKKIPVGGWVVGVIVLAIILFVAFGGRGVKVEAGPPVPEATPIVQAQPEPLPVPAPVVTNPPVEAEKLAPLPEVPEKK